MGVEERYRIRRYKDKILAIDTIDTGNRYILYTKDKTAKAHIEHGFIGKREVIRGLDGEPYRFIGYY